MVTVAAAVSALTPRFAAAGIDTARLDARLLVAAVAGIRAQDILLRPDLELTVEAEERLAEFARRREGREPVSRILGARGFWTLDLEVGGATLDPRPDTETVIEVVLERRKTPPGRILDLGTGTGAILLALLSEYPQAVGVGTDLMPAAVDLARRNAARCGLGGRAEFLLGSWTDGVTGPFEVVVSNPPYIPAADIPVLEPEVRNHDPLTALVGEDEDGLGCYRILIPKAVAVLAPGGLLVLEVGIGQAPAVTDLMNAAGFEHLQVRADLGGVDRCVSGLLPS
ncbi:peptide chain release factor N(5)-glutamine methyltransferase [Novispirillum itersonii]|uniref:Release factor glutamine methyltransferase n=1 Tax=Novispirillum itersonii TaxID=189 RepID=A0A7W9ZGQ8_NOVIT|nr:peptide chain release factor N(5)-glutamine methyltransferase [Novispirillum itersonii]MBB6209969.1 release factor glutamine methyltransferase [Novispirillum itersonii]